MKKHNNTDRIFKEKVENHEMESPMHLFEGISNALNNEAVPGPSKEKNPLRHGYWLLALLTLILAGSGIWYTNANNTPTISANEKLSIIGNGELNTGSLNKATKARNSFIENDNLSHTVSNENIISKSVSNNVESITIESENKVSNLEDSKKPNTKVSTSENVNFVNDLIESKSVSTSFSKTIQNGTVQNSDSQNIFTSKGINQNAINVSSEFINVKNNSTSTVRPVAVNLNESNSASSNSQKSNSTLSLANTSSTESVLFLPRLNYSKNLGTKKISHDISVEPKCGLKSDGSKIKFTTSIDVFFSPDYASQILEYKSNDFRDYAKTRTESEQAYYSFNTGVRVNFLTENGWAIRTGLAYTQINEILETQHKETVLTIDISTGDTLGYTEGIRNVNIRNKYKMVDIPLIVGYEVPMKKFKLNVNGGVYLNLMSEQSGAFFSSVEDRVVYFTEGHADNHDIFKDNIGLSVFIGLGFNFDLNKKTQLIVEPHTRYYPRSFTLNSYILNQKYFSTGVMLGLRRDL